MVGRTLAHYRILEKLGQGGMGVVYKALDTHLDRFVALKVLPEDKVADPERRRRFVQEAKAASALNHPNIVTIYGIEQVDGVHFIAMEYVAGKTLHEMIQCKDLRLSQTLDYGVQIADALSKAHSAGIVHRDLKPSNVMVTDDGLVKVLDFGLAKLTDRGASSGGEDLTRTLSQATEEGMILGTLAYMSPEQARGQDLDHRTDIFSLGVALYQMISGELPFRGPNAVEVLDSLLHSPTPSLKPACPDLPDALERTVMRATAKAPGDRYQSMQELASDLRSLRGAPNAAAVLDAAVQPTETAIVPRLKKTRRPDRWTVLVVAALVLLGLFAVKPFRARLPRWLGGSGLPARIRLVVLPFSSAGTDAQSQVLGEGLMDILTAKFGQVQRFHGALSVVPANEVRAQKVVSAADARRVFHANLALTGTSLRSADRLRLTVNLVDSRTLEVLESGICDAGTDELIGLQQAAFEKAVAFLDLRLRPEVGQALNAGETKMPAAANAYIRAVGHLGRYDDPRNIDEAIAGLKEAILVDPNYALARARLGEAYWRKYQRTGEQVWVDVALANCQIAIKIDSRIACAYVTRGMIYKGTGQFEKAAQELNLGIDREPSAEAYRELANVYEKMSRIEDAEFTYKRAIRLRPDSWPGYWYLGVFYYNRARYKEAAAQFLEVIRCEPDHARAYSSLGGIYVFEKEFDKAEAMLKSSLSIEPTQQAYSNFGSLRILQRRYSEAVPLLKKATEMGARSYVVWGNLAEAYANTPGLSDKARGAYAQAAELARGQLAVNSKDGVVRASLASYLIAEGDKRQALEEIQRAVELSPKDENVLFRSALVYELAGDRDRALKALASAAANGYSMAVIQAASDLVELRKDPRYRDLVEGRGAP